PPVVLRAAWRNTNLKEKGGEDSASLLVSTQVELLSTSANTFNLQGCNFICGWLGETTPYFYF
ncbi:MAG: hypothetical protein ABIN89_14105, partial [Chitinophagaceae bacterium]